MNSGGIRSTSRLTYDLVADGVAPGIYTRSAGFEGVAERLNAAITSLFHEGGTPIAMRCAPIIARRTIEQCGYLHSFPHLLGTIHAFGGNDAAHSAMLELAESGGDWSPFQAITDVALTPAACYAVYPRLGGVLPSNPVLVDVESWCFRQEPTLAPERMRSFRMRELVCLGSPDAVRAWRSHWLARAQEFVRDLGLEPRLAPANDPFFGAASRFLANSQRDQGLKYELILPVREATEAACASCNYHLDHFGQAFGVQTPDGLTAHTACLGFGIERMVLALLTRHGPPSDIWPRALQVTS